MSSIRIESAGQTWSADAPRVFRIGRQADSDIIGADPALSRQHAEIRATADGWEVVDLGGSGGTYVDGRRVERADLGASTTVSFGQVTGLTLTVTVTQGPPSPPSAPPPATPPAPLPTPVPAPPSPPPAAPSSPPSSPPPPSAPPALAYRTAPAVGETTLVGAMVGPPTSPGAPPPGPAGAVGGSGLLIRRRLDTDLRFGANLPVRIGREPDLEVVADDQAVSRRHAVVEPRPDGWWWVDQSTSGSYVDGELVTTFRIEEAVAISLGHPTAGYEIEVVPVVDVRQAVATIARKRRLRTLAVVGAVAGVLVLLAGGITTAVLLSGNEEPTGATDLGGPSEAITTAADDGRLSTEELDRAKAASVFIVAVDADDNPIYTGSGSIISDDGLILTNAHVGEPSAPGRPIGEENPAALLIALTSENDDTPALPTFRAEPIVSDGVLDLAILKITADIDGNPIEGTALDLPEPMPIGRSDAEHLRTGDEITALGFPAIASLDLANPLDRALTVTRGVVSTFKADDVIGSNRAEIDSDIRIGSGNSGGASINDRGELVGINSAVITSQTDADGQGGAYTGGSALIRPIDLAADLIEIARAGGDPAYVSPYLDQVPTLPATPVDATYVSAGWALDSDVGCTSTSTVDDVQVLRGAEPGVTIFSQYVVTGLPDGTPYGVHYLTLDAKTDLGTNQDLWRFGPDEICLSIPYTVAEGLRGVNAVLLVGEDGTPVVDDPVVFR